MSKEIMTKVTNEMLRDNVTDGAGPYCKKDRWDRAAGNKVVFGFRGLLWVSAGSIGLVGFSFNAS